MNNSTVTVSTKTEQVLCILQPPDTATKIALTAMYAIIGIVALFGNCTIILIAKTKKQTRKMAFHFFIISMAIADILDSLIAVPKMITSFYLDELWFGGVIGNITCKLFHFLPPLSLAASVSTLTAMSVERYLAIVHLLREPLSKKMVSLALLLLWILSSLTVSTSLIKYKIKRINGNYICYGIWSEDLKTNLSILRYEVVTRFALFYVIPFCSMIVLYTSIIHVLRRRQVFGENMSQKQIHAQNVTVVKMLVTVVVLFAFVWLPTHIILFMTAFDYKTLQCRMATPVLLSLVMLAHANGALNPCIYLIFNEHYRKGIKQLLLKCRRKQVKGIGVNKEKQWRGSSTLERDPSRGGIKGFFRDLSKVSRGNSDEVTYETRF